LPRVALGDFQISITTAAVMLVHRHTSKPCYCFHSR
jgi:hypothetical protein